MREEVMGLVVSVRVSRFFIWEFKDLLNWPANYFLSRDFYLSTITTLLVRTLRRVVVGVRQCLLLSTRKGAENVVVVVVSLTRKTAHASEFVLAASWWLVHHDDGDDSHCLVSCVAGWRPVSAEQVKGSFWWHLRMKTIQVSFTLIIVHNCWYPKELNQLRAL